jgi:hypothetical protein
MPTSAKIFPQISLPPAPLVAENLVLPQAEALIHATGADLRIGGNSRLLCLERRLRPGATTFLVFRADQLAPDRLSRARPFLELARRANVPMLVIYGDQDHGPRWRLWRGCRTPNSNCVRMES